MSEALMGIGRWKSALPALVPALVLAMLAGCSPRGSVVLLPEAASVGSVEEVLVATTRGAGGGTEVFSRERSEVLSFARFEVSVPPERAPGTVTAPNGRPSDPARHFVTVSASRIQDEAGFVAGVNAAIRGKSAREREAVVFVHGFNTNFAEGLYRQAQMRHDFRTSGVSLHYSWPSAASVRSYALDRESALFARDGLEAMLVALARSDVERILVLGHSMGAQVLMETLRQMAIRGSPEFFAKLGAIILMAPDLDVQVFRAQLAPLAGIDVPVYVFVSSRDRALRFSSFLRGQSERLGSMRDVSGVAGLPVVVIDISDVDSADDPLGHFKVATSPSMIALISGFDEVGLEMFRDQERRPNVFETTINVVQDVTEVVLQPLAQ